MIGPLIGMIHLGPLPGAPRFGGDLDAILARARRDAAVLADAGFDALLVENFGDDPFFADRVPPETIASMTSSVLAVGESGLPVGVNVLRNDAIAALAVAAATGAAFIRVNVLSGVMHTDQGTITGRAAEVARLRSAIAPSVAVIADVFVKHAVPPAGLTVEQAALDLWERAGADGIVVSGTGTGAPVDRERLARVAAVVPDAPLYIGSGATAGDAPTLLATCAGIIVGTAIKVDGVTANPVDADRARAFVAAVAGR